MLKRKNPQQVEKIKKAMEDALASAGAKQTGMTAQHLRDIQEYAVDNDVVILWRPINEQAATKLESGYTGKGIDVKAKSSSFGPIAGDIPASADLSKLLLEEKCWEKIAYFQKNIDELLQKSTEKLQKFASRSIDFKLMEDFNNASLVIKIDKTVEIEQEAHQVYYLVNDEQKIFLNDQGLPTFIIRKKPIQDLNANDNAICEFYFYDYDQKNFSTTQSALPPNSQIKPVEILAYQKLKKPDSPDDTFKALLKDYPITADYDELASAARKIYPFDNNDYIMPGDLGIIPKDCFEDPESLQLFLLHHYESKLRTQENTFDSLGKQFSMGNVTEIQFAQKVFLKELTKGATNHGGEENNPFPEKFTDGKYLAFLPNGTIEILKNEQEICSFYNKWRKKAFPLKVNPRWGWEVNAEGELIVPSIKLNWDQISSEISVLKAEIVSLEEQLNREKDNLPPDELQSVQSDLNNLREDYQNQLEIIEDYVALQRRILEPEIIYSKYLSNYKIISESCGLEDRNAFFKAIKNYDNKIRQEAIAIMREALKGKMNNFTDRYYKRSILEIAISTLNEGRNLSSSYQSTSESSGMDIDRGKKREREEENEEKSEEKNKGERKPKRLKLTIFGSPSAHTAPNLTDINEISRIVRQNFDGIQQITPIEGNNEIQINFTDENNFRAAIKMLHERWGEESKNEESKEASWRIIAKGSTIAISKNAILELENIKLGNNPGYNS